MHIFKISLVGLILFLSPIAEGIENTEKDEKDEKDKVTYNSSSALTNIKHDDLAPKQENSSTSFSLYLKETLKTYGPTIAVLGATTVTGYFQDIPYKRDLMRSLAGMAILWLPQLRAQNMEQRLTYFACSTVLNFALWWYTHIPPSGIPIGRDRQIM